MYRQTYTHTPTHPPLAPPHPPGPSVLRQRRRRRRLHTHVARCLFTELVVQLPLPPRMMSVDQRLRWPPARLFQQFHLIIHPERVALTLDILVRVQPVRPAFAPRLQLRMSVRRFSVIALALREAVTALIRPEQSPRLGDLPVQHRQGGRDNAKEEIESDPVLETQLPCCTSARLRASPLPLPIPAGMKGGRKESQTKHTRGILFDDLIIRDDKHHLRNERDRTDHHDAEQWVFFRPRHFNFPQHNDGGEQQAEPQRHLNHAHGNGDSDILIDVAFFGIVCFPQLNQSQIGDATARRQPD